MRIFYAENFEQWREQARTLLTENVIPIEVTWSETAQQHLFAEAALDISTFRFAVPREFVRLGEIIACHRSPKRWDLLYQLLFRLTHGEKTLLHIGTDPLMHALEQMENSIRRDAHKMKAFVRFRLTEDEQGEHYIAWHKPDHYIVAYTAPFFARRFGAMRWTILTPDASVSWDGEQLNYGQGVGADAAPPEDQLENLWRDYYRATFNPARIKLKAMKREMPIRHWATLPETQIIDEMLAEAPERVAAMIKHSEGTTVSAADFLPPKRDLAHLRKASQGCEGCELYKDATQTVFGVGPAGASLMLVGEQPGNEEDLQGEPFVGPAGRVLAEALETAGLTREDVYITNAVKHFRFIYRDSFRQHQSPSPYHMRACKAWLTSEIAAVKPKVILCLGNTAARALIQPNFMMKTGRGQWFGEAPVMTATYHPSSLLRARGDARAEQIAHFHEDIQQAAKRAA